MKSSKSTFDGYFDFLQLCKHGTIKEIIKIIKLYPNLNIHANKDLALIEAIRNENTIVVKYLIENYNCNINTKNFLPLKKAILTNNYDLVKYLLTKKAKLSAKDIFVINKNNIIKQNIKILLKKFGINIT